MGLLLDFELVDIMVLYLHYLAFLISSSNLQDLDEAELEEVVHKESIRMGTSLEEASDKENPGRLTSFMDEFELDTHQAEVV